MNSKKVLVVQFRTNEAAILSEQRSISRELGSGCVTSYIDAFDESLPWDDPQTLLADYTGLVLGGSGEFDFDGNRAVTDEARVISKNFLERIRPVLSYVFEVDFPTFGICYGHQLIGAHVEVPIVYNPRQKKTGTFTVHQTIEGKKDRIFQKLPASFGAIYGHKDILRWLPPEAVLLAEGGGICTASALRYQKNIYTVQFHPELSQKDMAERLSVSPGYLPEGIDINETFKETPEANTILRSFVEIL